MALDRKKVIELNPWKDAGLEDAVIDRLRDQGADVTRGEKNAYSEEATLASSLLNASAYGISLQEYAQLILLGREIFAKHLRGQANSRKRG